MQWLTDAKTLASPHIVVLLVGNKKDLENKRDVNFLEASNFAQESGEQYFLLWLYFILNCFSLFRHDVRGNKCVNGRKCGRSIPEMCSDDLIKN